MKKVGIIVTLIILTFYFNVKADTFIEIDCNDKNVTSSSKITCEVNLVYEDIAIDDIDFEYDTNLNIEFLPISGFSLNKNGNKISIHSDTTLPEDILDSRYIVKFTLMAKNNSSERESVTLKNFKINKNNNEVVDDVTENFNITLENTLDSNCDLTSITIDNVLISNFDKDKLEYRDIVVNKNTIKIDVKRGSDKSVVTGAGEVFIKPGETIERDIEVIAEDKSSKVYKLFITNNSESNVADEINTLGMDVSNDNTLKSLELYNGSEKIPFKFNNNEDTFDIIIENTDIKNITIKATTNHNKATFVDKFGPRDVKLIIGDNKILVKVLAENKKEKTYTLNITLKEMESKDTILSSLIINNLIVNLDDNVSTYTVDLPIGATKTVIEAVARSPKSKVEFEDIDLSVGKNDLVITVVSLNGNKREYYIAINRGDITTLETLGDVETTGNKDNIGKTAIIYAISLILIVLAGIIYIIIRKRKNKINIDVI